MFNVIIENIRNWFSKKRNEKIEFTSQNTPALSSKDLHKTSTTKVLREDGNTDVGASGPREGSRSRSRKRRGAGRRRSSDRRGDTSGKSLDPSLEVPWDMSEFQVLPSEGKTRFHDLDLPPEVMHGIHDQGFEYCTPIQSSILPKTLEGADVAGRAQTGTGKTAVFLISILTHLLRKPAPDAMRPGTPRALVLAPTRELALQIERDGNGLGKYTQCKIVSVFGGMDYEKQKRLLSEGQVDIVAATPGRLLDFKRQGEIHLDKVEILIIDEADRMLDMGFIPDVQQIINATPPKRQRQTMLFSATLTPEVNRFASQWTRDPVFVEVEPEQVAVDTVDQVVYITTIEEKFPLLYNLITKEKLDRVIVFCNRRDQTRHLTDRFKRYKISSALLSGDVDQKKRIKTLDDFRNGRIRVLVATDVAARGLHIDAVSHVVNYNLPLNPEDYVHRIGRTGRAGASGISISFASEDDAFQIPAIEVFLGRELHCEHPDEELLELPPPPPPEENRGAPARTKPSSRRPKRESGPISRSGRGRGRRHHSEHDVSSKI